MTEVNRLANVYKDSEMLSPADTTDVSVFVDCAKEAGGDCPDVTPLWVIWALAAVHVLFNQEGMWRSLMEAGAISYRKPWSMDEHATARVYRRVRAQGGLTRSSNS